MPMMPAMKSYRCDLSRLLKGISDVPAALNTQIHGIQSDSQKIKKGDLFIALSGARGDALRFVPDAIARGASAVLIENDNLNHEFESSAHEEGRAVELYVANLKGNVGEIAHRFFAKPSEELFVVGITGTNGKTSVSNYLAQFENFNGLKAGVIGTLGYGLIGEGDALIETHHTTPDVVELHRYFAHLRDAGAQVAAVEVSSHGLAQQRVAGVRFDAAIFTNLSRDHLDYHGDMQSYLSAKAQLFMMPGLRFVALNADDPASEVMAADIAPDVNIVRYSVKSALTNAEISIGGFTLGSGVRAKLKISLDQSSVAELELQSSLLGEFNLSNLLSVAAYAIAKGYDVGALKALSQIEAVAGRMERFMAASGTQLVVDYAHTPAALENVLATLSQLVEGKLSVVFGCGGDRDKGKRPLMAEVAERYADQIIVTDDNPRTEDPEEIVEDIIKGFSSEHHYQLCRDRKQAISQAFCSAQEKDIILVAGKGHEDYQEVNGHRHYFSDAEVCRELIALPRRSQDGLFA